MKLTDTIIAAVCDEFGVTSEQLRSRDRHEPLVTIRHIAMFLVRQLTGAKLLAVAGAVGRDDHTSALNGIRQALRRCGEDPALWDRMDRVRLRLLHENVE